jgi:hypothetical protein
MQISPLGGRLVSALSISIGENGSIPLLTLTLTTITSMQLLIKQAYRPLHVHTTMLPQAKLLYIIVLVSILSVKYKNQKRVALATKNISIIECLELSVAAGKHKIKISLGLCPFLCLMFSTTSPFLRILFTFLHKI